LVVGFLPFTYQLIEMTLFRPEAIEHRRRKVHGEVMIAQPVGFGVMTAVFAFSTLLLGFFMVRAEFARKETIPGWLEPERGVITMRAQLGGRLAQVFVEEGARVEEGDPLFLVNVDVESRIGRVGEQGLAGLDARLAELGQQMTGTGQRYDHERERQQNAIKALTQEISSLQDRINIQTRSIAIAQNRLGKMEKLAKKGFAANAEVVQLRQALLVDEGALNDQIRAHQSRIDAKHEARLTLKALPDEKAAELSQLRGQIAALEQSRAELEASRSYLVRAPIDGIIAALHGSVGQMRAPAQPVVTLVPADATLVARLLAPSAAIGFLEPGQDVNLLYDAFSYQKFGVQKGHVIQISKASYLPGELNAPFPYETSVYQVTVALDKQTIATYGHDTPLLTGATLQGDLVIERRSLFEWLFDPLIAARRRTG
jgi:membrane fusion protein